MHLDDILFIDSLPSVDLHMLDRDTARVYIEDFLRDHYKMKNQFVVIIHGIHGGVLRKTTQEVLKKNTYVEAYKISPYNIGCTIVELKVSIIFENVSKKTKH